MAGTRIHANKGILKVKQVQIEAAKLIYKHATKA